MNLQIGLTDQCNYRCIMCMQTAHTGLYGTDICIPPLHKGRKGFIDKKVFASILEQTSDIEFDLIKLQWLGESLLHPELIDLLRIFSEYNNYRRVVFTTNLYRADKDVLQIISSLPREVQIVVSLDSVNSDIYRMIKGVDRFDRVWKNVIDLLGYEEIIKTFQAIVMDENSGHIEEFVRKFRDLGIHRLLTDEESIYREDHAVFLKRLGAYDQKKYDRLHYDICREFTDKTEIIEKNAAVQDALSSEREACPGPFRTITFNWDGSMTYCCMDSELELSPGSIRDMSFKELWFGEHADKIRKDMLSHRFSEYSRCARCGNLPVCTLKKDEIAYYEERERI